MHFALFALHSSRGLWKKRNLGNSCLTRITLQQNDKHWQDGMGNTIVVMHHSHRADFKPALPGHWFEVAQKYRYFSSYSCSFNSLLAKRLNEDNNSASLMRCSSPWEVGKMLNRRIIVMSPQQQCHRTRTAFCCHGNRIPLNPLYSKQHTVA